MTPSSPRTAFDHDPLDQHADPGTNLDPDPDPDLVRLTVGLDALYTSAQPPAALAASIDGALRVRAAVRRHADPNARPRWTGRAAWRPRRPFVFGGVIALAVVVLTAGVFGGALLNTIFPAHLDAQDLHISRTVDGFTITVERAYADANRVIIGYTVATPAGQHDTDAGPASITLATHDGIVLNAYGAAFSTAMTQGLGARVESFDAAAITGSPATVALHLVFADVSATPQPLDVPGPWVFDFSLPFHAGRIAVPDQTVVAGGVPLTLEHVVITPSEARAFVRGAGYDTIATLANGGWSMENNPLPFPTNGIAVYTFDDDVYDLHGTWTLTVAPDARPYKVTGRPVPPSWTFRFDVP